MTKSRKLAAGALALLVLAAAAGASGWLREAYQWLVTGHDPRAGLDLSTQGLDFVPGGGLETYGYASRYRWAEDPYGSAPGLWRDGPDTYGGAPDGGSGFVPYAGLGVGVLALSMDLGSRDLVLVKEKRERRSRVFAGLGYALSPELTLGLEYRARAGSDPLVSVDLGGLSFDLDDPFADHDVTLSARYRF